MVYTISTNTNDVNVAKTKKSENTWLQWMCTLIEFLPMITYGLQSAWLSPITTLNHNKLLLDSIPDDVVAWSAPATYIAAAASSVIFSFSADKYGRKPCSVGIAVFQLLSWIFLLIPHNVMTMLILSKTMSGIGAGGSFIIIPSYLMEISKIQTRGRVISLALTMQSLGFLLMHIMGYFLCHDLVIYVASVMPLLHLILSFLLTESPVYLVKVGKVENALTNLSKLRKLDNKDEELMEELNNMIKEKERAAGSGRGTTLINIFRNQVWRDGLKVALVLQTVRVLCGSFIIVDHSSVVLQRSRITFDPLIQVVAVPAILFISCATIAFFMDAWRRKILLIISSCTLVMSFGILAVFMQTDLTVRSLNWLPLAMLATSIFGYGIGFYTVSYVVINEILNFEIRLKVLGVVFTYVWLLEFLQCYLFKYIQRGLGLDAIIYMYAAINIYGVIYTLFAVPETLGAKVGRIERSLKKTPLLKF